ncbi:MULTISPECIES: hypothetical protein [unclassified Neptuniibacter]|uniref:hypothetical protein n=1 Tax=unclassified Neptuniibacter TaxID=2630693 RepID=UPI000C51D2E0|nr:MULTISPECIES: hypothetical protein [unclassified Neptuniibacter]MAY42382.1 hypothetical protein [Oceanospirillaceae bacterium]|tara:strand:- start:9023 stop:11272 length:2250 start_codon:yes stop_codon:yes gene_type:complete
MSKKRKLQTLSVDLDLISNNYDVRMDKSRGKTRQFGKEAGKTEKHGTRMTGMLQLMADGFDSTDLPMTGAAGRLTLVAGGMGAVSAGAAIAAAGTHLVAVNTARLGRELEAQAVAARLSIQTLQEIGYASEQVGIDAEKAADIFKDWQDKLGDFRSTGAGEFADFFEQVGDKVGLTADELARMSGPDALIAVKKAMDDANVSADRQVFYLESLADDASKLSPLLANNGEQFRQMVERYREMDVALTDSQLQKFKEYDQDIKDLQAVWDDLTRNTVIPFVGVLADGAQYMQSLLGTTRTERLKELREEMGGLSEEIVDLEENGKKYGGGFTGMMDALMGETGTKGERVARRKSRIRIIKAEIAEIEEAIASGTSGALVSDYEPPTLPSSSPHKTAELEQAREAGVVYLSQLDMQFASELQKLDLQHAARLQKIEALQLSQAEIESRGFEDIETLRAAYADKAEQDRQAKLEEQRLKREEEALTDYELVMQEFMTKAQLEDQAWLERQEKLDNALSVRAISEDAYRAASLKNWEKYQKDLQQQEQKQQLERLQNYENLFDGIAGVMKSAAGEQSGIYRIMFAASKAFAIAQSIIKIQQGIAEAASLPFPTNIPAIGTVISATAGIVSTISGTEMPSYHTGGIAGQPSDNYGDRLKQGEMYSKLIVGEEVITQSDPRHRNNLKGGSGVAAAAQPVIHIHTTEQTEQQTDESGDLHIYVGAAMDELERRVVEGGNSTSDAVEGAFGLQRQSLR